MHADAHTDRMHNVPSIPTLLHHQYDSLKRDDQHEPLTHQSNQREEEDGWKFLRAKKEGIHP